MASLVDWFKKKVEQPVAHFVSQDIVHPVASAVNRDVAQPVAHAASNVVNAVQQAPQVVNRDVFQPVVQHIAKPIFNAPQTITNDVFKPVTNFASREYDQLNPLDNGLTFKQRTPTTTNSTIHQLTHNGLTNAGGSLLNNVTGIPTLIDTGRLGVGELTHNQPAIDNATVSLNKNLNRVLPISMANSFKNGFGQDIATALTAPIAEHSANQQAQYAQKVLNDKTGDPVHDSAVDEYADAVKTNLLNQHLNTANIDMDTPTSAVIRKVGGDAANAAANIILSSKLPSVLAPSTSVVRPALTYGSLNSLAGLGQTAAMPNPTAGDYIRNGALGFVEGAALPIAGSIIPHTLQLAERAGTQALKEAKLIRPAKLSDSEVANISKMRDISGTGAAMGADPVFNQAYNSLAKIGVNPNDTDTIDRLLGDFQTHNTRVQQRQQALNDLKQRAAVNNESGYSSGDSPLTPYNKIAKGKKPTVTPEVQADPLASLKQEALKYKSADEFNKAVVAHNAEPAEGFHKLVYKNGKVAGTELDKAKLEAYRQKARSSPLGQFMDGKIYTDAGGENFVTPSDLYNQAHAEAKTAQTPDTSLDKKLSVEPQPLQSEVPRTNQTASLPKSKSETPTTLKSAPQNEKLTQTGQKTVPATQVSPQDDSLPNNTPKQRGFTTSVKESQNYTKDLKKKISSEYAVVGDKQTIENTQKFVGDKGVEGAHADVLRRLSSSKRPDKQLVNDAGTVMQILDSQGKTAEAQVIHDKLAEHLTNSGQVSQAAGLLLRRSPDGIYHKAVSDLQKAGVSITPDVDKQLQSLRENIRSTMPDTSGREIAVQKMKQFVSQNIPSSLRDKVFAVWRAGLLTGPRTVAKILTSHGIQLPLETIKDIPAAAIDKALSYVTGQRSLVLTNKGIGSGLKEGAKAGFGKKGYLRTGIDTQPGSNAVEFHNEVNFKNKALSTYTNGIGRLHGSLYKPFYGAEFKNSLNSQALAAAKTARLKGQAAKDFANNFVKNPSKDALDVAKRDAEHATFQQETALGKGASAIQKIPVIGRYIAPFTRIPSAIASDLVDYSPVGLAKAPIMAVKAVKAGEGLTPAIQRQLVQGLGRGLVGTAALAPGAILYNKGMLNFQYPSDSNEQKIWAIEGRTENSVLVDGKWRSLGSLGPLGAVLALGGGLAAGGPVTAGETALKTLEDQPYVSGITQAASALQDPGRYLTSLEKQYAGSVIPTAVAQVASAGDAPARQANTPIDTVKSKIPGLRQTLAPKTNAFGQQVKNGESGPGAVIDPFYSSTNIKPDATTQELQRLNDIGEGTMVSSQAAKNTFDGVPTQLTKAQAQSLSAQIGRAVKPLWDQTIASPNYKVLNDDNKHKVLSDILSDTTSAIKRQFATQNNLGQYSPNFSGQGKLLTTKQQSILTNSFTPDPYITSAATQSTSTASPAQKYQTALANYTANSKNMTDVQKYSAQASLAKLKVQKDYSNDVVSLYGMSKAKLASYLSTSTNGVDKKSLYSQLVNYDNALYNAGLITTKKFKYGLSSGSGGGGSSSKSSAGAIALFKAALDKQPLKIVGALPAPKRSAVPSYKTPALRTVYKKQSVNTKPKSSLTKTKR